MKSFGAVLLLLCLLCLLVFSLSVGSVGKHAVDAWAEQAGQPDSVTDTVRQSRQTPPIEPVYRTNRAWFGAGLLALVVLVIGAMLFMMHGGTEFLRQWRLTRKRPFSRQQHTPQQVPYPINWPELPHVPTVRYLPEVDDEQVVDSWD
ncbi:MAG: hypothetical protein IAF02_00020 [Anaerolineae bacterium]|nr:hypothetical protein [Anaerolineae bacterium]